MNFLFLSILNLLYFSLNNCYFAVFYNIFYFFAIFLQFFCNFFIIFYIFFRILNLFYFFFHVLNNFVHQNFDNISEYYF